MSTDPAAAAASIEAPTSIDGRVDLYAHYEALRSVDPIHRSQHPLFPDWFVSRHRDIHHLLRDRRFAQDSRNSLFPSLSRSPL